MAQYGLTYSCGHSDSITLYGPTKERKKKIAYFEDNGLCRECWKAEQRAKEEATPITATVTLSGEFMDDDGVNNLIIALTGNTRPKKEEIKALGYQWGEYVDGGILGMLSTQKSPYAWTKLIQYDGTPEVLKNELNQLSGIAKKIEQKVSEFDIAYLKKQIAKKREREEKLAKLEKPSCPDWMPDKWRWNGRYYGRPGNESVYLNGECYDLSGDRKAEFETYMSKRDDYLAKKAEIKTG